MVVRTIDPAMAYLQKVEGPLDYSTPDINVCPFWKNGLKIIEVFLSMLILTSRIFPVGVVEAQNATLVQIIDTSQFVPPNPNPAGIAYLDFSDSLLMSDSEVNEIPLLFTGDNVFEMSRAGFLLDTLTTIPFSDEPTGVALNTTNNHLFISDDNEAEIFEVNPGIDGDFFTADDIVTSFDTAAFNSTDPEGVAFDSGKGALFIADGLNSKVYQVTPGTNGIFDGVAPAGDDQVTHFDTANFGVTDPEGIEFEVASGHLFVVGRDRGNVVVQLTTMGTLVREITLPVTILAPAGITLAPGSVNPGVMNLYITDRGVDNGADPNENDGKVYEFSLPVLTPGNTPPTVDAGPDQTIAILSALIGLSVLAWAYVIYLWAKMLRWMWVRQGP